ncbi:MAG: long-chain fatty acid--CoA ligase [Thermodesulfobacteriota bacterium]
MEKIWLKSYGKGVPATLRYHDVPLSDMLTRTASRFPYNPALHFQGNTITYDVLDEMVSAFAGGIEAMEIHPGDKVGILLPNIVQVVVAYYGVLRAGGIAVMLNPLQTDPELDFQLNDSGVKILVCLDLLVHRMMALRPRTDVKKIVSCHVRDFLPFLKKQLFPLVKPALHLNTPKDPNVVEFMDILNANRPPGLKHSPGIDDTASVMYTGGTTGTSKGVELTHRNLSYNCQQVRAWFPRFLDGKQTVLGCLPFFHSFGMTTAMNVSVRYGFSNVLIPKPEAEVILKSVDYYKPSYIPVVPTLLIRMISHPKLDHYDLTSVKACFSGAAPLARETIREFEEMTGAKICEGYGLTEASPIVTLNPYSERAKPGTVGIPLPDTEVKLVSVHDHTWEITECGERGEVCIRGPQVMKGYLNRPEETKAAIPDGWLLTGDIGVMDEEGFLSIVDRKKDIIISGGFNVYPRDVDEVLYSHPKVIEACTIGVPSPDLGETITAYVVLKQGRNATVEEIIRFCRSNLAPYKIPSQVMFVSDLPKSPVGKILRKEVRRLDQVAAGKHA